MTISATTQGLRPGVCTSSNRPVTPFEGQMIYETDTDVLSIWNGSAWRQLAAAAATSGSVLQVQSTIKTDTFSTTSSSPVDVTGLSVSITPKSSSSKVLITFHISNGNSSAQFNMFNLVRNSTNLAQPPVDSYTSTVGSNIDSVYSYQTASFSHLDSPSTTSSVTYKIQAKVGAGTLYVNRRGDSPVVATTSSITVMEIAG